MSAIAALAACAPGAPSQVGDTGQTASVRGCMAVATTPWRPLSGVEFSIEARSAGPDCARAVATLVIRDTQGRALWTDARAAEHVMTLKDARDEQSIRAAMAEWIDPASSTMRTTATLPDWPAGAQGPENGEFPFYPEPHLDRESYEDLRRRNTPMFCYVQGMESLACVAFNENRIEKVGVQSFPG